MPQEYRRSTLCAFLVVVTAVAAHAQEPAPPPRPRAAPERMLLRESLPRFEYRIPRLRWNMGELRLRALERSFDRRDRIRERQFALLDRLRERGFARQDRLFRRRFELEDRMRNRMRERLQRGPRRRWMTV